MDNEDTKNNESKCPKCNSTEYIPICYGKPSNELLKKSERGEVILAGCCRPLNPLYKKCKNCGGEY